MFVAHNPRTILVWSVCVCVFSSWFTHTVCLMDANCVREELNDVVVRYDESSLTIKP